MRLGSGAGGGLSFNIFRELVWRDPRLCGEVNGGISTPDCLLRRRFSKGGRRCTGDGQGDLFLNGLWLRWRTLKLVAVDEGVSIPEFPFHVEATQFSFSVHGFIYAPQD